jgi:hypothetical protein
MRRPGRKGLGESLAKYSFSGVKIGSLSEAELYIQRRLDEVQPRLSWRREFVSRMQAWQEETRTEIRRLLGIDHFDFCDLEPEWDEAVIVDGYSRASLTFQSREGFRSFGYFLEPLNVAVPGPAVVCLPGHGAGVDAVVGLADEPYQAEFAVQCVRRGYRVLALEQMSFGHRKSGRNEDKGTSCIADAEAALMLDETLAGWRIFDAIRAVDLLQTVPSVDPDRIGIMGISGGGMTALWTSALDLRIAATVVSGYFCMFRDSILSVDHCLDNFVPGILNLIEMPDLAGLVAPRAFFAESGTCDPIFPVTGFRKAVSKSKEIYMSLGIPERFGFEEFDDEHVFWGKKLFEFLRTHL